MLCRPLGDSAVLVEVGNRADDETAQNVHALTEALLTHPFPGVVDIVPAYTTVAVHFDPVAVGQRSPLAAVQSWIERSCVDIRPVSQSGPREWIVPVVYGGDFGPDLAWVAEHVGLSVTEVIQRHAAQPYTVRAIGFSPGFPYLAGLPETLRTPRRATPRTQVPAGSVGIAGSQAGIYPQATPGGWNILGRTGLRLFDPDRRPPALLRVGDRVRFEPVVTESGT